MYKTLLVATHSNPFNFRARAYRDLNTAKLYASIYKDDGLTLTTAECDDESAAREFIKSWSFSDDAIIDARTLDALQLHNAQATISGACIEE